MASKREHDAARAKAAKEKKMLLALVPLLAIAAFFAYHTISKLHQSSPPTAAGVTPAAATTPAASVPTATTPAATTPSTTTPAPAIATPVDGSLTRLTIFSSKDPFHDQGPRVSASSSKSSGGTKAKKSSSSKSKAGKKTPAPPPTAAEISVNGHLMSVPVGAVFPVTHDPATNGIFKLVALTARSAKIAVAGGSYANGSHTLTLTVNSVVTLVNTADGKRYTLVLYPPQRATTATPVTTTTGP